MPRVSLRLLAGVALAAIVAPTLVYAQAGDVPRNFPPVESAAPNSAPANGSPPSGTQAAAAAQSQNINGAIGASSGSTLTEVVVTANRVVSTAQKTPIALNVYSGDRLQAEGVDNIQSLQTIDPSIGVTNSSGAAYVAVRGVASTDVTEIGDPAVPIARDGFFLNRSYNLATSLYDLDRIEVLKGPQGTLEGRNSTGGLVSIITKKPDNTTGGYAIGEFGDYSTTNGEGALNWAPNDMVQFRLSGTWRSHDGYRDVTGINERSDDEGVGSGRIQAAFHPFAGFRGWVSYQHDDVSEVGDVPEDGPLAQKMTFNSQNAQSFAGFAPSHNRLLDDRYRWEFSYDRLPLHSTLTYSGGYDAETWNHALDATTPISAAPPDYPATRNFLQDEHPDTFNHELRLASQPIKPLFFQIGYFHFSEDNTVASELRNLDADAPTPGAAFDPAGTNGITFRYNVHSTSDAVFGQGSYALTDQLKLTLGIRETWDEKERTGSAVLFLPALVSPYAPPVSISNPQNGSLSEHQPTYHIGVDYTPTSRNLLYAKFDTGYKSGGFNSNGSSSPVPYGPENVKTVEAGSKNRFLGNHLQVNGDIFYTDYTGYQASQNSSVLQGNGIFNVGSASIYGAEFQVTSSMERIGRFDGNLTYLHTTFAHGITVTDGNGVPHDISGDQLPNAPHFVAVAGFEHDFDVPFGMLTGRIDGKYSTSFYYDVFNNSDTESPSFAEGNVTLTYKPQGAPWRLEAYVRNFTDQVVLANAARNYVSYYNTYEFQPPRTYGGQVTIRF